jgi:hypothetical protein
VLPHLRPFRSFSSPSMFPFSLTLSVFFLSFTRSFHLFLTLLSSGRLSLVSPAGSREFRGKRSERKRPKS